MNERYINDAMERISSDTLGSALDYKKPRISYTRIVAAAALALAVGVGGFFALRGAGAFGVRQSESGLSSADVTDSDGGFTGGGETGTLFSDAPVTFKGEPITHDEIAELIGREKKIIAYYVRSENKGMSGEISIALSGYSHIRTDDNTVARDFVTLPVFTDGRIIAEVTVYRVDDMISYSVAAGGPGWERRNTAFSEKPEDKLCFVYVGSVAEVTVAPDNTVYGIGEGSEDMLAGIEEPYKRYATEYNTFSLPELIRSGDYVTVGDGE
ncbi:MAG: hypothetical protein IKP95_04920 [Ruminococcus sp.]|nr:hypothetical protein [Ruminococcus sp.]